jgi:hypothetical protein
MFSVISKAYPAVLFTSRLSEALQKRKDEKEVQKRRK